MRFADANDALLSPHGRLREPSLSLVVVVYLSFAQLSSDPDHQNVLLLVSPLSFQTLTSLSVVCLSSLCTLRSRRHRSRRRLLVLIQPASCQPLLAACPTLANARPDEQQQRLGRNNSLVAQSHNFTFCRRGRLTSRSINVGVSARAPSGKPKTHQLLSEFLLLFLLF